ncbi:MAG: type II secretion system F family protein [Solirubrobacterales bacterium]
MTAPMLGALAVVLAIAAAGHFDVGRGRSPAGASRGVALPPWLARLAGRLAPAPRIAAAGLADRITAPVVLGLHGLGLAAGACAAWTAAPLLSGRLAVVVGGLLVCAGAAAPWALLDRAAARRRAAALAALPGALELLASASAAGNGLAGAASRIGTAGSSPLARELSTLGVELEAGVAAREAWAGLARRLALAEVAAVVAAVDRSRRLGTPLEGPLRDQAAALRADRRRRVGEHAARAAPKVQLVVALVLVPSVLLVIAAGVLANADSILGGL